MSVAIVLQVLVACVAFTAVTGLSGSAPQLISSRPGSSVRALLLTDCKIYQDWQSIAAAFAWRESGQPGAFTRVANCKEEDRAIYPKTMLDYMDTHFAPEATYNEQLKDHYAAYNKPTAVIDWLAKHPDAQEEYVLLLDADMLLRRPIVPERYNLTKGWAMAAHYDYMRGVHNDLALRNVPDMPPRNDTLAGPAGRRGDVVGAPYLMRMEDIRRLAPLWYEYTVRVRNDTEAYKDSGDTAAGKGQRVWIAEMYGYAFGAAKAGVWHRWAPDFMLYPGYVPPNIPLNVHYGLHFKIGDEWSFDKHWFLTFNAHACPPWGKAMTKKRPTKGILPPPPHPKDLSPKDYISEYRDLVALHTVSLINAALCDFHVRNCPPSEELQDVCGNASRLYSDVKADLAEMEVMWDCIDHSDDCPGWAGRGECTKMSDYMSIHCRPSCKICEPRYQYVKRADRVKKAPDAPGTGTIAMRLGGTGGGSSNAGSGGASADSGSSSSAGGDGSSAHGKKSDDPKRDDGPTEGVGAAAAGKGGDKTAADGGSDADKTKAKDSLASDKGRDSPAGAAAAGAGGADADGAASSSGGGTSGAAGAADKPKVVKEAVPAANKRAADGDDFSNDLAKAGDKAGGAEPAGGDKTADSGASTGGKPAGGGGGGGKAKDEAAPVVDEVDDTDGDGTEGTGGDNKDDTVDEDAERAAAKRAAAKEAAKVLAGAGGDGGDGASDGGGDGGSAGGEQAGARKDESGSKAGTGAVDREDGTADGSGGGSRGGSFLGGSKGAAAADGGGERQEAGPGEGAPRTVGDLLKQARTRGSGSKPSEPSSDADADAGAAASADGPIPQLLRPAPSGKSGKDDFSTLDGYTDGAEEASSKRGRKSSADDDEVEPDDDEEDQADPEDEEVDEEEELRKLGKGKGSLRYKELAAACDEMQDMDEEELSDCYKQAELGKEYIRQPKDPKAGGGKKGGEKGEAKAKTGAMGKLPRIKIKVEAGSAIELARRAEARAERAAHAAQKRLHEMWQHPHDLFGMTPGGDGDGGGDEAAGGASAWDKLRSPSAVVAGAAVLTVLLLALRRSCKMRWRMFGPQAKDVHRTE